MWKEHYKLISLTALLLTLALTFSGAYYVSRVAEQQQQAAFERFSSTLSDELGDRLDAYAEALHGLQGFFAGSQEVGRTEFNQYVSRLEMPLRRPGFQVLGFARRIAEQEKGDAVQRVREDRSLRPAGYPDFDIRSDGVRAEYQVVEYLEPFAGNEAAFGFDLASEPSRRQALQRARDTGAPSATGPITLKQETGKQAGMLYILPVYRNGWPVQTRAQRRAALLGFVFVAFRLEDLARSAFGARLLPGMGVAVDDIGLAGSGATRERRPMLALGTAAVPGSSLLNEKILEVGGRRWELRFHANRHLADMQQATPVLVLLLGSLVGLLLFGFLQSLGRERSQALLLAEEITRSLRDAEARAGSVLGHILEGIITIDEMGIIQDVNPAAERLFGYAETELVGNNVRILMPESYSSRHDGYLAAYRETGERKIIGIDREVQGLRKDGSVFPMELSVTEVVLNGRRHFIGIVRDITARKEAERGLQETLRLQQAILDGTSYSIISTDTNGLILTFNRGAERLLGYAAAEVVGKLTTAAIHDANEVVRHAKRLAAELRQPVAPRFDALMAKARSGQVDENDWTYIRKDGSRVPVRLTVTALRDETGQVTGYLGIAYDLSERVRLETMKRDFVSTVSHELRTPLTSIRGSLGLIIGGVVGEVPAQARSLIEIAAKNCDRLVRLINEILDMEKVESGRMRFDMKPVAILSLVIQAIEANRAYAEKYGVTFRMLNDPVDVHVVADSDRLTQVLNNLLSNAAKHAPAQGEVTVGLTCTVRRVRVEVSDHGPGIPEEFRERIFQKFSQAESSDTKKTEGTGLGLAIAKSMIEQMGGAIGFASAPGEETTFWFELPELPDAAVREAADSGPARPGILVCEDDRDVAHLLSIMLTKAGYAVDRAYSAEEALQRIARKSYSAMTLDLALPGKSGIDLIRELRASSGNAHLPIVVVSGRVEEAINELGGVLPVADWLEKPVDQARLVNAVKKATGDRAGMPELLHVEDDPDIRNLVATLLAGYARVTPAADLAAARVALQSGRFDLLILDLSLPDGSGMELMPLIQSLARPLPVVVFSAHEVEGDISEQVIATLVKSRTSNERLLEVIHAIAAPPGPEP